MDGCSNLLRFLLLILFAVSNRVRETGSVFLSISAAAAAVVFSLRFSR